MQRENFFCIESLWDSSHRQSLKAHVYTDICTTHPTLMQFGLKELFFFSRQAMASVFVP